MILFVWGPHPAVLKAYPDCILGLYTVGEEDAGVCVWGGGNGVLVGLMRVKRLICAPSLGPGNSLHPPSRFGVAAEWEELTRDCPSDEREAVQKKTFTKWVNSHLARVGCHIVDLYADLRDGFVLTRLLEVLSGEQLVRGRGAGGGGGPGN